MHDSFWIIVIVCLIGVANVGTQPTSDSQNNCNDFNNIDAKLESNKIGIINGMKNLLKGSVRSKR